MTKQGQPYNTSDAKLKLKKRRKLRLMDFWYDNKQQSSTRFERRLRHECSLHSVLQKHIEAKAQSEGREGSTAGDIH